MRHVATHEEAIDSRERADHYQPKSDPQSNARRYQTKGLGKRRGNRQHRAACASDEHAAPHSGRVDSVVHCLRLKRFNLRAHAASNDVQPNSSRSAQDKANSAITATNFGLRATASGMGLETAQDFRRRSS